MNRAFNILVFISFFCFTVFLCLSANAGQDEPSDHGDDRPHIALGIESRFAPGVDIKDLQIAISLMVKELGEKAKIGAKSYIYKDPQRMMKEVKKGKLDLVLTTSSNYLYYRKQVELELAFAALYGGVKTQRYQVLVRSDSNVATIKDLKGQRLAMMKDNPIGHIYLNTLLLRSKQQKIDGFFLSVIEKTKYSLAILAVFFGKADACVATEGVFKTMVELNPQLGKTLKVIDSSPEIMEKVAVFRKGYNKKLKNLISALALDQHKTSRGKQILLLFKTDRLFMVEESDLEGMKKLYSEYEKLTN